MSQNLIDRVLREATGIERRKEALKAALKKGENENLNCENCGSKGALELSLTRIVADNLQIDLEQDQVILCHDCIRKLLNRPTLKPSTLLNAYDEGGSTKNKVRKIRERLLKMSKKEIASEYDISEGYAAAVSRAVKTECFKILIDNSMSKSEKARKLGVGKSSVSLYLTALEKVGLDLAKEGP